MEESRKSSLVLHYSASHLTNPSSSEEALRAIFSEFGLVQTCIVNTDKRHAFVKMLSRNDAMSAKEGMERYKSTEMQLRVSDNHVMDWKTCSAPKLLHSLIYYLTDPVGSRFWTPRLQRLSDWHQHYSY